MGAEDLAGISFPVTRYSTVTPSTCEICTALSADGIDAFSRK
jgi:hypothetical protein